MGAPYESVRRGLDVKPNGIMISLHAGKLEPGDGGGGYWGLPVAGARWKRERLREVS